MVSLLVNGEKKRFDREPTVTELLRELKVASAAVAVEVNREIVPRRAHPERLLKDGDSVEVVTFVGGG